MTIGRPKGRYCILFHYECESTRCFLFLLQSRKWEKQLQQVFDETDPDKLVSAAQSELEKYYASLPSTGNQASLMFFIFLCVIGLALAHEPNMLGLCFDSSKTECT